MMMESAAFIKNCLARSTQLCFTCLVADRALSCLTEDLRPHYMDILRKIQLESPSPIVPVICWECEAVLRRWVRFQEQAKNSFMMLQTALQNTNRGLCNDVAPRLPRLHSSHVTHTDIQPHAHNEAPMVPTDPLIKEDAAEAIHVETVDCFKEDSVDRDTYSSCNNATSDEFKLKLKLKKERPVRGPGAVHSWQVMINEEEKNTRSYTQDQGCTDSDTLFSNSEQEHNRNNNSIQEDSAINKYKCKHCQKDFPTSARYKSHLTSHTKPYRCGLCAKRFARSIALKTHMSLHIDPVSTQGNPSVYQCNECGKKMSCRNRFIAHIRTIHAEQNTFECTKCKKRYVSKYRLNRHLESHSAGKGFQCSMCGQTCPTQTILKFHVRTHTGEKPFECNECHKTFARKDAISSHMKVHTKVKPYQCHLCGYISSYRTSLLQHFRTHTKPWQCVECLKRFSCNRDFQRHMRSHTGEKAKKRFQCEVCSNWFVSSTTLKHHMRIHTGEKPYLCVVCGRRFRQDTSLKIHLETHGGKKIFQCNECQETFSQKNHFILHQRMHAGKKTYHCSQCNKHFVSSNVLTRHMRVHTGEKPYQCSLCQKRFQQKSGLNTHLGTHSGKKTLQCDQCHETLPSKNRLMAHRRLHAGEALHRCTVCNKEFITISLMRRHTRIHIRAQGTNKEGTA